MKKNIFILFFSFLSISFLAQYESRGKEFNFIDAEHFIDNNNYNDALGLFEELIIDYPKNKEYVFKKGVCQLMLNDAENALNTIRSVGSKKKTPDNYSYYLAKAYALNYQFDSAIIFFNKAAKDGNVNSKFKSGIPRLIEQCNNGSELIQNKLNVAIESIGNAINTEDYEYSPVVNAEETVLAFTYRGSKSTGGRQNYDGSKINNGNFYDDIYVSYKSGEDWGTPEKLNRTINTNKHETSVAMAPDGRSMYAYRGTEAKSGELYKVDTRKGEFSTMESLGMNSSDWEGSITISNDGKFAIFSSDRPGGFGGSDLYYVEKKGSKWGKPVNMGDKINTPFEEEVPFIYTNNAMFSFSSQGHNSIGGYDIFESQIINKGEYSEPRNLGYPINSTYNDLFFSISSMGNGFYSALRKGGVGQYDIYTFDVEPIMEESNVLLVKGEVPVGTKLIVKNADWVDRGEYYANPKNNMYKAYLPLGEDYSITFIKGDTVLKNISVDGKNLTSYTVIEENIIVPKKVVKEKEEVIAAVSKINLANPSDFQLFIKTYGNKPINDVDFYVQIGAYSDTKFFNAKKWNRIGKVTSKKSADGITRFTIGTYDTFTKAIKITEKAKKLGDKDAFVIVKYKGERTSLNKLIQQGVYPF